jgi:hypothetical protein
MAAWPAASSWCMHAEMQGHTHTRADGRDNFSCINIVPNCPWVPSTFDTKEEEFKEHNITISYELQWFQSALLLNTTYN